MRIKLLLIPSLIGMVLLFSLAPAEAAPHLTISRVYSEDEFLCIDFYFKNAVDRDILESMRNGIPTQLTYTVDVWHSRSSWYDKLIRRLTYSYRMHYDNWDTLYTVCRASEAGEDHINAGDVAELVHLVCNQLRLKACRISELDTAAAYYVTISAQIEALSAERVREIDSWLGGSEETERSGGGLLDLVVGIFGSRSKSAETRSENFQARGLIR